MALSSTYSLRKRHKTRSKPCCLDWRSRRLSLEPLEDRRLLSVIQWSGGALGTGTNWGDPTNWLGGVLPGANDDVVINVPASVTISHASGNDSIRSLSSANALTLSGGILTVAGTVEVDNTFTISGGTLKGATIQPGSSGQGVTFTTSGGTLDGVTANANLDLTNGGGTNATIVDGLTLNGVASLGSSSASVYNYARLYFSTTETLGGSGSIVFSGGYGSGNNGIYLTSSGTTLTIGSGITIHGANGSISGYYANNVLVNQGTINADTAGGTITVNGPTLTNQGTLLASNTGNLSLGGTFTLAGLGTFKARAGR